MPKVEKILQSRLKKLYEYCPRIFPPKLICLKPDLFRSNLDRREKNVNGPSLRGMSSLLTRDCHRQIVFGHSFLETAFLLALTDNFISAIIRGRRGIRPPTPKNHPANPTPVTLEKKFCPQGNSDFFPSKISNHLNSEVFFKPEHFISLLIHDSNLSFWLLQ